MVYFSPNPYHAAFEETLDLRWLDTDHIPTGGMNLVPIDDRLFLDSISRSTPAARIPRWRSRIKHAWLIKVNDTPVFSTADVTAAITALIHAKAKSCQLLFSHPEIKHGLTNDGIPQVNLDQLNNRALLRPSHEDLRSYMPTLHPAEYGKVGGVYFQDEDNTEDVMNLTTRVMKLTRGKLI